MKFWEVKAKANKTGELLIYGDITSTSYWGDEITPKAIDSAMKELGDIDTLNVYVNSGGGSVFAGMAIFNIIKRCKATTKNAYVDGLAASISSVIPLACDKVYMPSNSMMMVHLPSGGMRGNAEEMRKMADTLDKVRDTIIEVYKEKTGKDEEELKALMEAETWMTAKEAIEMGFADELQAEVKIAASTDGAFLMFNKEKFAIDRFKNVPELEASTPQDPEPSTPTKNGEESPQSTLDKETEQENAIQAQYKEFTKLKLKIYGGM
jgi:ATP-dependent Clp protease protease subunit